MAQKPPAFQFYPSDFLVGTLGLSTEEVGAYILLMCHQWDTGHLPDDHAKCARLARCQASTVASIWHKFGRCEDGKVWNVRLETEREKQASYREKQANNGKRRWKNSGGNASAEPTLSGGNASAEPTLSGGNTSAEPTLSGGNALRGQCSSSSSSSSIVPLSSPEGDNANPVTSLTEAAEKKEGGRLRAAVAASAGKRILAMFEGAVQLSEVCKGYLAEHAENGVLPADEKKWRALEAMRAERAAIAGIPDDFDLRAGWLISKERLCERLGEALDTAAAKRPQSDPGAPARTGSMTVAPEGWRARAEKKWPGTIDPSTEWTDLPIRIRTELLA